ncbi:hypothetical protein ACHAWX_000924 [Stephanocyclus meneghinianus]
MMSAAQSPMLPSSWVEVEWVSRHDESTTRPSSNNPSHSLASLCQELKALKHQFMPTSAACAKSINNFHYQNGSKEKTNASFEFRRARSMCNLYEWLGQATGQSHPVKSSKKRGRAGFHSSSSLNSLSPSGLAQFVNRSAIKLANIDALLNFSLTNPHRHPIMAHQDKRKLDEHVPHSEKLDEQQNYFAFVDLCGAPGGFSEYIMYRRVHPVNLSDDRIQTENGSSNTNGNNEGNRRKCHYNTKIRSGCNVIQSSIPCYGFGMSLIGSNVDGTGLSWDFSHLQSYHLSSTKHSRGSTARKNSQTNYSNVSYHVCKGSDDTGDIYNWDNVLFLRRQIDATLSRINIHDNDRDSKSKDQRHIDDIPGLVHLVVADGGFDAQRDSMSQEEIAHCIVVCQTATALTLLKPGGNFVLKMFGFQLERTKRVLQHLYSKFERVTFVKPILSRPASAERYLVCCGYDGQGEGWNGVIWKQEMMNEMQCSYEAEKVSVQRHDNYSNLNTLMHSFDIQMLQLNIDACRSILDHLNERSLAAQKGDVSAVHQQKIGIDLQKYERLWQLW